MKTAQQKAERVVRSNGVKLDFTRIQFIAPADGTYKISVGSGGYLASLTSLDYDIVTSHYSVTRPFTYFNGINAAYLYGQSHWLYVPKGTKSLDLEIGTAFATFKTHVKFYNGLPTTGLKATREVVLSGASAQKIALQPGEAGSLVSINCTGGSAFGWGMPNLYSVPNLWAETPGQLLVPRAIAQADGLTALAP
jgi:hypothetical protein